MEPQWEPGLAGRVWRVSGWTWEAPGPAWCWCEKGQRTPPAPGEPEHEGEPAAGEGQSSGTQRGWCAPGSLCGWLPSQPHTCASCSPCWALTRTGDLGEEPEKIISGVERQIQGKGLEELNQACASKREC